MLEVYDNWERLIRVTLRREEFREMARADSRSPSTTSSSSSFTSSSPLHDQDHPIIHRDIKSSNVLLTKNLGAKLSDFGLALLAADSGLGDAPVSTEVKGTAGYLDPEYANTYQLTQKCDVYSFGVLLVELVTGRHPIERKRELKERITARWAMKEFSDGDAILTLDPRLERSSANIFVMVKVFELASQCLAPQQHNRPTMKTCGDILWSIRMDNIELSTSDIP